MCYIKLISFVHMAVHSLAPKWKEACCICGEFVSLCFKIVKPLSIIDYAQVNKSVS